MLTSLKDTQNEIKQELFLIRNNQELGSKTASGAISKVAHSHTDDENVVSDEKNGNTAKSTDRVQKTTRKNTSQKEVIWFGTPLFDPMDFKKFERETNTSIKVVEIETVKTGHGEDNTKKSLGEVVKDALKEDNPDMIIFQGGDEEINRINVQEALKDKKKTIQEYKSEWAKNVEEDSKEVLKIAEDVIKERDDIEVVILERLPRYDRAEEDPEMIKKELTNFANKVYQHEMFKKATPNNLHVVDIKLDCENRKHLQDVIYGKTNSNKFNGFHLKGTGAQRHLNYRTKQALKPILEKSNRIPRSQAVKDDFLLPKKSTKRPVVQNREVENQEVGSNVYSIPVRNRFVGNF